MKWSITPDCYLDGYVAGTSVVYSIWCLRLIPGFTFTRMNGRDDADGANLERRRQAITSEDR